MTSRGFNTVVVLFWLATMSWLVVVKILPSLRRGTPPDYQDVYASGKPSEPPVCWTLQWNDRPLGWAVSRVNRLYDGSAQVESRVHFSDVPLGEMVPRWLRPLVEQAIAPVGEFQMNARSSLNIDALGKLVSFKSSLRVADLPDAIRIQGTVEGSLLRVTVESGEAKYPVAERHLPEGTLISDELTPQARMPDLKIGQTWTVPVYSPLKPPDAPVEILQATVEASEVIRWNSETVSTLLVVYRSDSGLGGFFSVRKPRGRLWVRSDGLVLKQELNILESRLTFVRMPDAKAAEFAETIDADGHTHLVSPPEPSSSS